MVGQVLRLLRERDLALLALDAGHELPIAAVDPDAVPAARGDALSLRLAFVDARAHGQATHLTISGECLLPDDLASVELSERELVPIEHGEALVDIL